MVPYSHWIISTRMLCFGYSPCLEWNQVKLKVVEYSAPGGDLFLVVNIVFIEWEISMALAMAGAGYYDV